MGKMDFGDLVRMSLMGASERLSAAKAQASGLVSEVTAPEDLMEAAMWVARTIAESPSLVTQGTLRSLWMARELSRRQALDQAYLMTAVGTDKQSLAAGQERFSSGTRLEWRLR